MSVDLTPFGFTPTESGAYEALLDLGPASGYGVAKVLSIARANAYQALDGLVAKGAAVLLDESPKRYRALQPQAMLAHLTDEAAAKLDHLETQVASLPLEGAAALVPLKGIRAVLDTATRSAVLIEGSVICLAPPDLLSSLAPTWRARRAAGRGTELWSIGSAPELPMKPAGEVSPSLVAELFADPPFALWTPKSAVWATVGRDPQGYWASDSASLSLVRTAIRGLAGA
jgi:hypothetical protein